MIQHRGPGRGSIITGSSVHNSRVGRTHRDVYSGVLAFYSRVFQQLEAEGNVDVLNDVHIFSLHHIYIPRIQNSLEELVSQMNNRPVSTERNHSPLQMWDRGKLENLYSGHTALSEAEIEHLGIDPDGVLSVEVENYQEEIDPPLVSLPEEQKGELPDPLTNDGNSGKDIYLQCIEVIHGFLCSSHGMPPGPPRSMGHDMWAKVPQEIWTPTFKILAKSLLASHTKDAIAPLRFVCVCVCGY